MRQKIGGHVFLFNQNEGEVLCEILEISQNKCKLKVLQKVAEFIPCNKQVLCVFGIIKPQNVELIIQKCTEIGVFGFLPVAMERTCHKMPKIERLRRIIIEACEQCGRIDIPEIFPAVDVKNLRQKIEGYDAVLLHQNGNEGFLSSQKIAVITGVEGGFSQKDDEYLSFCKKIKISQNILRSETASILGCGFAMQSYC